jgi:hypothetical protein
VIAFQHVSGGGVKSKQDGFGDGSQFLHVSFFLGSLFYRVIAAHSPMISSHNDRFFQRPESTYDSCSSA